MENASKALLAAAGILVGILILSLIITLFISSKNVTDNYDTTKQTEAVQKFNTNFTKYLGQNLTIHQVVTICNFAGSNASQKVNIKEEVKYQSNTIKANIEGEIKQYKLKIESYNTEGYINKISFEEM